MRVLALESVALLSVARLAPIFSGHPLGRGLIVSARAQTVLEQDEPRRTSKGAISHAERRRPTLPISGPETTALVRCIGRGNEKEMQKGVRSREDLRASKFNRERCQGVSVHEYPIRKAI
jgi:hypothetical protein